MKYWKVKACAIQFSPIVKWPTPHHQPRANALQPVSARAIRTMSTASPASVSGQKSSGAKPQAAIPPAIKAVVLG